MNEAKIVQGVKLILEGLEVDTKDRNYIKTPFRVKDMLKELFTKPAQFPQVFEEKYDEMVVLCGHKTWTLCPHHLLPVELTIHIAYIPQGGVVGLSKMARIAEAYLSKPTLQETLTHDVADGMMNNIKPNPLGAACVIEGAHLCMRMRGIKTTSRVVTSAMRGSFLTKPEARQEFLALTRGRNGM